MPRKKTERKIERTRIINAQITFITDIDANAELLSDKAAVAEAIKQQLGCDNVVVTSVKNFVMEKK